MRPYLAIIRDSFREALHSRVLWLLGIVITLVLMLLAPLSYQERMTINLVQSSVRGEWHPFLFKLRDDSAQPDSVAEHVASLMTPDNRKALSEFKMFDESDIRGAMKFNQTIEQLRRQLNELLRQRHFYSPQAWRDVPLATEEGRLLLQRGIDKLNDDEVARLNRLLLEAAYPDHIEPSGPVSLQIHYLVWDVAEPVPFRRDQANKGIEFIVGWVMKYFIGVVGVIIAVLVTASIIPQTFDPGSLNLLLSKPISRSLLFLSKFVGGCAFIVCNASYLIIGLWAILGFRFGVWDTKLLLAIPIYLFMFAIYYTVSSLAGVIWRNPIVSVALTVLFWLVCFVTGLAKWLVETRYVDRRQLVRVIPAGDALLAVNEMGRTYEWDSTKENWKSIFVSDIQNVFEVPMYMMGTIPPELLPVGPVYDAKNERIMSIQRNFRGNQMGKMFVYTGDRANGWESKQGPEAEISAVALVKTPQDGIIELSHLGIWRLTGNLSAKSAPLKIMGFKMPMMAFNPFERADPEEPVLIARPFAVAVHADSGDLAIYSRGLLTLLRMGPNGRYERRAERRLPLDTGTSAVLGWTGNTVLLGRDDGILVLYDDADLKERGHWKTTDLQPPRFIEAAPGGRWFAVTLHGGKLWLIDAQSDELTVPDFAGSGPFSTATFANSYELLVVDQGTRVSKYLIPEGTLIDRWAPPAGPLDVVYSYCLLPVYTVCPKPGDLDDTVEYLMSARKTTATESRERANLDNARKQLDPWGPVWSSAAFVVVLLGLCCIYLERQEF